jgi:hypothetical protein
MNPWGFATALVGAAFAAETTIIAIKVGLAAWRDLGPLLQ